MYESQVLLLIANSPSVQRVAAANALARGETVPAHESAEDANLDEDEDDEATEDQFVELEEDLANVIADVHDLGEPMLTSLSRTERCATDADVLYCNRSFLSSKLHGICQDCQGTLAAAWSCKYLDY